MEVVLVDLFIVPDAVLEEFVAAVHKPTSFLRSLPGFVEGWIYTREESSGRHNVVTTAIWENEAAYRAARQAAQDEYALIGWNPQEIIKRLGIEIERGEFKRAAY